MQLLDSRQLKDWINSGKDFQLIDVREQPEHEAFNIGGILIPLPEIMEHISQIESHRPVVFYCRMGIRSQIAIQRLESRFGMTNLYNLKGGMDAWQKENP